MMLAAQTNSTLVSSGASSRAMDAAQEPTSSQIVSVVSTQSEAATQKSSQSLAVEQESGQYLAAQTNSTLVSSGASSRAMDAAQEPTSSQIVSVVSTQSEAATQKSSQSLAVEQESGQCEFQNKTPQDTSSTSAQNEDKLEEYETQFFGFTPKSFVSGIYNAVSEYFMEALQVIENYMAKEYGDLITPTEAAEKMTFIRKHLVMKIDEAFDTLEVYLASNIFCVPPSVVLPEDRVQMDAPVSQEEHDQLLQEIETMTKKIMAIKLANDIMKQRITQLLEVQNTFDAIVEYLDDVQASFRQEGVVDLRDSLNHCAQNVLETLKVLKTIKLDAEDEPIPAKKEKSSIS